LIRRAVFISWATRPTTVHTTTYYYYDGKYYTAAVQEGETVYVIVSTPEGMEVDELPPDAEEQEVQGQSYWYAQNTFYQQIQRDGKAVYVVVDAPSGAVIPGLPEDAMEVEDEGDPVYQYDDTYYAAATSEESPTGGYVVQPPPPKETIETDTGGCHLLRGGRRFLLLRGLRTLRPARRGRLRSIGAAAGGRSATVAGGRHGHHGGRPELLPVRHRLLRDDQP